MLEKNDYQFILLDVMMPGMDGFQTMEKIWQKSSVPILMLTSKNDSTSKVRGLRSGADDYLTKSGTFCLFHVYTGHLTS